MRQFPGTFLAAAIVMAAVAPLDAEDYRFTSSASLLDRVQQLEAQSAQLEAELDAARGAAPATDAACCCDCGGGCYWYAGYDNVIVKPRFSRNSAFWETINAPTLGLEVFHSFDWDYEYTPRFWIGYVNACGTGLQVRYWQFDHATDFTRSDFARSEVNLVDEEGGLSSVTFGQHQIRLHVVDLEVVRQGDYCWGWLRASGGLRYAEVDQRGMWVGAGTLNAQHEFEGLGPTLFAEAGVPLGCGNLSAFANGRASILFGEREAQFLQQTAVAPFSGDNLLEYDSQQTILEAQVGADWATCWGGNRLSVRAALEAQSWLTGGSVTAGDDDEGVPFDHTDLGFYGASFSATLFY